MNDTNNTPCSHIIMGVDPGSRHTGCAVIKVQGQTRQCLLEVTLHAKQKLLSERLLSLHTQLAEIINHYKPNEAAIEQVFVKLNPHSALVLGHVRGALLLALAQQNIPTAQYAPRLIKQACVGYGNASKLQVQQMMQHLFQLKEPPASDAADALAVALCHAHSIGWRKRVAKVSAQSDATSDQLWL